MSVPSDVAALAVAVQQQTDQVKQFKDEQINIYTATTPTVAVTDAEGQVVTMPSFKALAAGGLASQGIFQTIAAGIGAVADGQYFQVPSTDNVYLTLYRRAGTGATKINTTASAVGTDALVSAVDRKAQSANALALSVGNNAAGGGFNMKQYDADGSIIPVVVGSDGGVVFGIDMANGNTVGSIVASMQRQILSQGNVGSMLLYDADDIVPIWIDSLNNIVLGFQQSSGTFVGSLVDQINAHGEALTGVRAKWKPLPASLVAAIADWNGIPMYGQSLSVGAQGHPALSLTQPYSNQTFAGGTKSAVGTMTASAKPLVEDNLGEEGTHSDNHGETMCSGMANALVEFAALENAIAPAGMVVFTSSPGQSGQPLAALVKGTQYYTRLIGHVQAAKNLATAAGKTYAVSIVTLTQGETDADNGTTQAAWLALANQWVADLNADIPAITGQATPVHVLTYQTPYKAVAAGGAVQMAQKQWVDSNPLVHFSTPIYHLPYYQDRTHMINVGYLRAGRAVGRAAKHLLIDQREPDVLVPISATARALTVSVRFDVPMTPLILDVTNLATTRDFGFLVADDAGTIALSGIRVVGSDTVQMTLARPLGANPRVRYALDYLGNGLFVQDGGSGNLRDSTPDTTTINGTTYPMWHVAFAFQQPILILGS